MGLFNRFVEIGRVVLINYGPDHGKLAVIIEVIDHNRVFIDGPANITGVQRQTYNLKRLSLTDIKIKVPRMARQKKLAKEFTKQKVLEHWEKTSWAQKIKRKTLRSSLNDFSRFQVMLARKKRRNLINDEVRKLKLAANPQQKPKPKPKKKKTKPAPAAIAAAPAK